MSGIIGKKVGMTSLFNAEGKNIPCTVIQAGPCVVTQIRTEEKDGYSAIQLGFDEAKEKNTTAPLKGHFAKANTTPKRKLVEFKTIPDAKQHGDVVDVTIFEEGEFVDVVGTSKGKGFQGVMKRHGFGGVGGATHGQHNRLRAPGSLGASSWPSRVFKGMRMAGRTGGAYAARISTMQGNEEIDALTVFGIPISGYILLPSIVSLSLMMPLLYIYGCVAAILGGLLVGAGMLELAPAAYMDRTFAALTWTHIGLGLAKSFVFGVLVAMTGCYYGLHAQRNAAGVGTATTQAVVVSIVGIITVDAVFALCANALGL